MFLCPCLYLCALNRARARHAWVCVCVCMCLSLCLPACFSLHVSLSLHLSLSLILRLCLRLLACLPLSLSWCLTCAGCYVGLYDNKCDRLNVGRCVCVGPLLASAHLRVIVRVLRLFLHFVFVRTHACACCYVSFA